MQRSRRSHQHRLLRPVPILSDAIWSLKYLYYFSNGAGRHIIVTKMAVSTRIIERHFLSLESHPTSPNPPSTGTDAKVKPGSSSWIEKCSFFADKINYLCVVIWTGPLEIAESMTRRFDSWKTWQHRQKCDAFWSFATSFNVVYRTSREMRPR